MFCFIMSCKKYLVQHEAAKQVTKKFKMTAVAVHRLREEIPIMALWEVGTMSLFFPYFFLNKKHFNFILSPFSAITEAPALSSQLLIACHLLHTLSSPGN